MGGDSDPEKAANRLGLPLDLVTEAEGFKHQASGIYPDNVETVSTFSDMMTQWRTGPGGVVGLDYSALPAVFNIRGIKKRRRPGLFDGIRIMEQAALNHMWSKNAAS